VRGVRANRKRGKSASAVSAQTVNEENLRARYPRKQKTGKFMSTDIRANRKSLKPVGAEPAQTESVLLQTKMVYNLFLERKPFLVISANTELASKKNRPMAGSIAASHWPVNERAKNLLFLLSPLGQALL